MLSRIRKSFYLPVYIVLCLLLITNCAWAEEFYYRDGCEEVMTSLLLFIVAPIFIPFIFITRNSDSRLEKIKLLPSAAEVSEEKVARLIQDININECIGGKTPLMLAVEHDLNYEVIRILIEYGAKIDAVDDSGNTLLMTVIEKNSNPEVLQVLVEKGANVNAVNNNNRWYQRYTPLMFAARFNSNPEVLRVLIEKGADVNAASNDSRLYSRYTPLMLAARFNSNPGVLRFLVEKGANVNAVDKYGKKALDYAAQNSALKGTDVYSLLRG